MPLQMINDQWIHYEDTGESLPPMVLAHGLLMDCEMFAPQVEAFRSRCRVITWDARCHGQTETTDEPFTHWDLAEDLRGLLDHLGVERAVIGGTGQGGCVALRFALKHPERVAALVLLSTHAGRESPAKVSAYESILQAWETEGLNDQLAQTIAANILGNDGPGREAWIAKWRQWTPSLLRPAFNALVGREDIHDRLEEISAPSVVIYGTADAAIEIQLAQLLSTKLANCGPLFRIERGSHACNLTQPKLVNQAMLHHLLAYGVGTPRGIERRVGRRRADPARRAILPSERRIAERRDRERRESRPMHQHGMPGPI